MIRSVDKRYIKPKGQSRMDNPEKLVTFGTQDEDKQNKTHNTKSKGNMKKHGLHRSIRGWSQLITKNKLFLLLIWNPPCLVIKSFIFSNIYKNDYALLIFYLHANESMIYCFSVSCEWFFFSIQFCLLYGTQGWSYI